jgi:hypothetical protein
MMKIKSMKSIGRLSFALLAVSAISIIATSTAASANPAGSLSVVSSWPKSAQPIRCSVFGCRPINQCASYTIDLYRDLPSEPGGLFPRREKLQPAKILTKYQDGGANHVCVHDLIGVPEGERLTIELKPRNWVYPSGVNGQQMLFSTATTTLHRTHPDRPASGFVQITGGLIASPR